MAALGESSSEETTLFLAPFQQLARAGQRLNGRHKPVRSPDPSRSAAEYERDAFPPLVALKANLALFKKMRA